MFNSLMSAVFGSVVYIYQSRVIQLPADFNNCIGRKYCWTGQERSLRDYKA